jgi:hypothetical protein
MAMCAEMGSPGGNGLPPLPRRQSAPFISRAVTERRCSTSRWGERFSCQDPRTRDSRKGTCAGEEDDETNLWVEAEFARDIRGGRKTSPKETRTGREKILFYYTRDSQTRGSSMVVLVCFPQGIGTYI